MQRHIEPLTLVPGPSLDNPGRIEVSDTLDVPANLTTLCLPSELSAAMISHLRAALPHEGVGLLAIENPSRTEAEIAAVMPCDLLGRRFYPGTNVDESPTRYTMDPQEVIAAFADMESHGWQLGAIVHSHPATQAVPSVTDLREAAYPDALMLIVSFQTSAPDIQAWRIRPTSSRKMESSPSEVRICTIPTNMEP